MGVIDISDLVADVNSNEIIVDNDDVVYVVVEKQERSLVEELANSIESLYMNAMLDIKNTT